MLEHLTELRRPRRVVVIGAAGFVGGAVAERLERDSVPVLRLTRAEVDLAAADGETKLAAFLRAGDALVAAAARAPCKNADQLLENLAMARTIAAALGRARDIVHVVNISSDAVYADSPHPLTEESCASPNTLHGVMHLAREVVLNTSVKAPLAHLRPSLLYGARDPHDGYGPNRFRRLAAAGEPIVLFGEGEERRDHVFIDDLAELVAQVIYRRSTGTLNVASGEVHSFRAIAEKVVALSGNKAVTVKGSPRSGPMPHGGYRPFDISACKRAFADFRYTSLPEGLKKAQGGG
ncbi:MAG TPA: NAD(P)-dependent oxidoreductase [Burkholderiales bacterium]